MEFAVVFASFSSAPFFSVGKMLRGVGLNRTAATWTWFRANSIPTLRRNRFSSLSLPPRYSARKRLKDWTGIRGGSSSTGLSLVNRGMVVDPAISRERTASALFDRVRVSREPLVLPREAYHRTSEVKRGKVTCRARRQRSEVQPLDQTRSTEIILQRD